MACIVLKLSWLFTFHPFSSEFLQTRLIDFKYLLRIYRSRDFFFRNISRTRNSSIETLPRETFWFARITWWRSRTSGWRAISTNITTIGKVARENYPWNGCHRKPFSTRNIRPRVTCTCMPGPDWLHIFLPLRSPERGGTFIVEKEKVQLII